VDRVYDLKFRTEDYNPVGAYFTLQARRQLTRIAVASHGMLIEQGVYRLAQDFLRVRTLHRQRELAEERIKLAQRLVAYAESLRGTGSATGLQVEMAEQALDVARISALEVDASKQGALNKLKILMGMDPSYKLELDLEEGYKQLMSDFDTREAALAAARKHSFDLKVAQIKEKLQDMNIIMAYTKFLPSLHMYLETTDPLSGEEQGTLYFSVGLEVPLWDGFKRVRNVSRQKLIRRQLRADRRDTDHELVGHWQAAHDRLRQTDASARLGRSRSRLAALQERESLIRYQSHQVQFPDYADRRVDHLEALGVEYEKELDHALAVLDLRRITGNLTASYVKGDFAGSQDSE
jgi:outer membrane protein TolC